MSAAISSHQSNARLRALSRAIRHSEFVLTAEPCLIGRLSHCHVVITLPEISRLHARIELRGAQFVLIDAGSANGTYVNGLRIYGEHTLRNHDEIGLASYLSLLEFVDQDATDMMPQQLQFKPRERSFEFLGVPLQLPPNLFRLLSHLYQHRHSGEFCSDESCIRAVWPDDKYDPDRIELLHREVSELRHKFRAINPHLKESIRRLREVGYRLEIDR